MMVNRLGLPVLLFFSFTSEIVLAAPDGCPDLTEGYTYVNFGKCYQFVNTERYWPEAQTHCHGQGGNLVTVDSAEKQTWIVDKLNAFGFGRSGYWIGAHDRHGEGDYMWDSGVEFSYSNWNSGQPDNSCPIFCANTDCVLMRSDSGYRWYDYPCSSSMYHYAYICEFAHIPPTTTTTTTTVATTTTTKATTKTTLTTMTPPTTIFTASSTFPLTDLTSTQAATQTSTTAPNTTALTTTSPKSSPATSSAISTITQTAAIQTATLTPSPSTATPTKTTTGTRTTDPTTTPTGNSSSMPTTTSAINPTTPSTTQTASTTATSLSPKITTIQANITISTVANTPVVTQATTSVTIPTAMHSTALVTSTTARSTATPTPPTTTKILSSFGPPTATTSPLTSIVTATANPMTTSFTTTKSTTTPGITSTSSPAINITSRQTTTPAATPPTKQTTKPTMKQSTIGKTTKIIGTKPGIQTTSGKPGKEGASRQTGERNGVTNNLAIIMGCVAGGIVLISIAVFVVVRRKKLSRKNLFTRLTSTRSFSPHPQYNNPIYDDVQVPAAHFNQLET